jgi:hypothetical protein
MEMLKPTLVEIHKCVCTCTHIDCYRSQCIETTGSSVIVHDLTEGMHTTCITVCTHAHILIPIHAKMATIGYVTSCINAKCIPGLEHFSRFSIRFLKNMSKMTKHVKNDPLVQKPDGESTKMFQAGYEFVHFVQDVTYPIGVYSKSAKNAKMAVVNVVETP